MSAHVQGGGGRDTMSRLQPVDPSPHRYSVPEEPAPLSSNSQPSCVSRQVSAIDETIAPGTTPGRPRASVWTAASEPGKRGRVPRGGPRLRGAARLVVLPSSAEATRFSKVAPELALAARFGCDRALSVTIASTISAGRSSGEPNDLTSGRSALARNNLVRVVSIETELWSLELAGPAASAARREVIADRAMGHETPSGAVGSEAREALSARSGLPGVVALRF